MKLLIELPDMFSFRGAGFGTEKAMREQIAEAIEYRTRTSSKEPPGSANIGRVEVIEVRN